MSDIMYEFALNNGTDASNSNKVDTPQAVQSMESPFTIGLNVSSSHTTINLAIGTFLNTSVLPFDLGLPTFQVERGTWRSR